MVEVLFDDIFRVEQLNPPEGKKAFDKVTRIEAKSERFDMFMRLDINSEIYPLQLGQKFALLPVPTLNPEGKADTGYYALGNRESLATSLNMLCMGSSIEFQKAQDGTKLLLQEDKYISFGGLMMLLGDPSLWNKFELDQRLYLLIRKV